MFERAIDNIQWPYKYEIYVNYLVRIIESFGGVKLDRIREVFKQCLSDCP